jgi:hypothetical protein
MLIINDFRTYLDGLKAFFPEIEQAEAVIDDSQINKFLEDFPDNGKFILLGIIPKHKPTGDVDSIQSEDTATLLLLKKVTRSDQDHNTFLNSLSEAQQLTRLMVLKMRTDKLNDDAPCAIMKYLNISSIDVNPIWAFAGCDGYEIDFSLETPF